MYDEIMAQAEAVATEVIELAGLKDRFWLLDVQQVKSVETELEAIPNQRWLIKFLRLYIK